MPVNYRQLGESIEEAIVSGSVALDTIGATLINADGQTVSRTLIGSAGPGRSRHFRGQTRYERLSRSPVESQS